MLKITRDLVYTIARHSNWRGESIAVWLRKEKVYAGTKDWIKFLQLFLLGLGGSFIVAGVMFFFAYNWADMHKFLKLGLLQALLLIVTLAAVFSNRSKTVKNVLLTASVMLTGVMFAVFGQIYQTGANAYDFFLGWTMSVVLWVVFSRFQPLWLILLALINTTFILYNTQVVTGMPFNYVVNILFGINAVATIVWEVLAWRKIIRGTHKWLPRITALAAIVPITMSMVVAMYDNFGVDHGLFFMLAAVTYSAGIWHGLRTRDLFYLSVIPFSIIIVVAAGIVRLAGSDPMVIFLVASLFVIGSITLLIRNIIHINRKWHGTVQ
ncbi:DUF2157 domain-containing protein [Pontibacter burrus]|uniref:DUF2157 domain-containing protein n=1 Tax=Pontibacter burrus TaxID=2704466 RepID=A0A6B3LRL5_9BACT|nr:DUF2157 domain-containing protein [Pontibacter burrus]NEM96628.1 DUF2157 domain-containing protein [Pontibacter burrus]